MDPLVQLVRRRLWPESEPSNPHLRKLLHAARYPFALLRDLASGDLNLRAMSLVYTTMLAAVPTFGFAFALAKALGLHNQLEPQLMRALQPIGPRAREITDNLIGFAENINGGVLGILSFGLLLITVISMAQKVEGSFNFVWRVDRPRNFARRFSEYLSVILIGPTVMLIAITLITSLSSTAIVERLETIEPLGTWITYFGDMLPIILTVLAFSGLYIFVPNTRVRLKPALIGGLAGGVCWAASGYLFSSLVVSSARLQSIYSGFAIVLILMLWLYLSWLILLLGSQLAFYLQNPFHLRFGPRTEPIGNEARERLCLSVMYLIASDYARPAHGWTDESLASALRVPRNALEPIMATLTNAGLIVKASEQRLMPGRDPHGILLSEVVAAVRGQHPMVVDGQQGWGDSVDEIIGRIDAAIESELRDRTLGQLVEEHLDTDSAD